MDVGMISFFLLDRTNVLDFAMLYLCFPSLIYVDIDHAT